MKKLPLAVAAAAIGFASLSAFAAQDLRGASIYQNNVVVTAERGALPSGTVHDSDSPSTDQGKTDQGGQQDNSDDD